MDLLICLLLKLNCLIVDFQVIVYWRFASLRGTKPSRELVYLLDCFHRALLVAGLCLLAMTLTVAKNVTARRVQTKTHFIGAKIYN